MLPKPGKAQGAEEGSGSGLRHSVTGLTPFCLEEVKTSATGWQVEPAGQVVVKEENPLPGTAYQKLQLHQKELLVNDPKSIKKIVELVGGSWGVIPLERKFELVEKALFRGIQKQDESSESYLSRVDVVWSELLSKGVKMEEIQSYIVLRGSRIASEDKKRVIVESGAEEGGVLDLKKVRAAIRMLGSGFFQEMTGAKRDKGLKTYDHTAFAAEELTDECEHDAYWVQDELDDQVLEALAAEDDEDAALVLQFEDAICETIQNDSEMCAFYSTYQDARKRLAEKVRFRGFWTVKKGEKGYGKKGKFKGKGKGSLASRIANSYCRICMKKGHWKNECPSRNAASNAAGTPSTSVPTTFAVVEDLPEALINMTIAEESRTHAWPKGVFTRSHGDKFWGKTWGNRKVGNILEPLKDRLRKLLTSEPRPCNLRDQKCHIRAGVSVDSPPSVAASSPCESQVVPSLFATAGTTGVVDLGASQTVIGSEQVPELLSNLPDWVRAKTRRCPCNLTFRFGNHQTLVSRHAMVLPLGTQSFRIAIVEGRTPFLISNSFLKGLKAVIDTDQETLYSKLMGRFFSLQKSNKNLFLMDINQLWETEQQAGDVQSGISAANLTVCPVLRSLPNRLSLRLMALSQKLKAFRETKEEDNSTEKLKAIEKMTLQELEGESIQFGKAKLGMPFPQAFEDGRWTDWFIQQYEKSSKVEHAKYVMHVTKRLDAEIAMESKGKPKQLPKAKMPPKTTMAPKAESVWEEDLANEDLSEFIPISEAPMNFQLEEQVSIMQEENNNLRQRMTQIEMALHELIVHVKKQNPDQ
eukprot:s281_g25.t1